MKHSSPEEIAVSRISRLALPLIPAVGIACVVLAVTSMSTPSRGVILTAVGVLCILSTLAAVLVALLRSRCRDLASEKASATDQVRVLQDQNDSLRGNVEVLAAIREVSRVISDDVDFCKILDQVFQILERLLRPEEICVIVKEELTSKFVPRALRRRGVTHFADIDPREAEHALFELAIGSREMKKEFHAGRATFVAPLIVDREVAGAIKFVLRMEGTEEYVQKRLDCTTLVVDDIARHIALAIKTPTLHARAVMDGVTGLYSRTHFENQLKFFTNLARRYNKALSLIMMDIDKFKLVNDQYGHLTGDSILNQVASAMKVNVRDCDSVYRYGGEELAVILPETTALQTQIIAERLRRTVSERTFSDGRNHIRMTVSIGVAELDHTSRSYEDIVMRADRALYDAKENGRNRTSIWLGAGPQVVGTTE